ncbi:PDZ domain protein [Myxococcus xanthus DK 1622]|uniref:PDZ domain protein n=1 Tax=Myxococcus xanthus (strain DK1622) TaxID=246197 RepID=Q1CXN1_MYXXD|nr:MULTISPECIES: carboxypeptidase regulatory-like domain-containing protein [Myxococcus]ABF92127.1 PDZ domain protein [Myxococcus xanthus DK 1622]NOJ51408.1 PDZ domain-containing protein [Myxococcus xanthus]QPM79033.1 carboxypeptidase regulatory-like domain-containing protein [Myxococcus xanthus]
MRHRTPFLIALCLAIAAVLLLWFRMPVPAAPAGARPEAAALNAPAPVTNGAPSRASTPPTPPLETAPDAELGAFVVRVVNAQGPVTGARVRAYLRVGADGTGATPWRRAGEGTTADGGVLRLPAAPGDYLLSAHAPDHGPVRLEATRPLGEAETAVELRLPDGVTLSGRTVAEGREEPVPLATLTLRPYPGTPTAWAAPTGLPEEVAETASDAQGRFAFTQLAPGRYELTAEAPGFSRRTLRLLQVPRAGEVVVGLWGASTLEGFVVDAKGQPVADAEVVAAGGTAPVRVTTGEGGGFALEVNAGTWVVSARRGDQLGRVPGPLSVAPGETLRGLMVTLGAASGLTGTVSTVEGAPVRGAILVASPAGGQGELGRAASEEDGEWRMDVPPGEYDVTVRAVGMTGRVFEAVVVNPGGHTPLDVRLEPATAALEGLVVDAEGRPLGGAQVRAEPASFSGVAHTALTDAEGAWKLEGLEARPTSVRARREGSQRWTSRMETLKAGVVTRADFTLADSGSVWGQVTRASGGPLTEPALVHAVPRGGSGTASTETDAQGQFQLELPAGVYQLVALLHQTPAIYFHMESDPFVTVPSGGAVRQDLLLKEDSVLSGVVLEPSGVPSPLAIVAAIQGGDFPMTRKERADEAGQFAMPPRPQGAQPLELVAHNAGRVGRLPAAHEDQAPLTVRLEPAATLRGRVVAGSGAAPDGFTLELLEANGEALPWAGAWPTTRRFAGSTFLLPDAPAQALKVTVRTEDGRTGEAQVTLRPGGTSDVEVPLTGGVASISGRAVWSRGGGPAPGVAVFLDKAVGGRSDAFTGQDGRFRLSDVRPGIHTVRLLPPEGRVETRTVKVAEAEATDVGDVTVSPRRATPGTLGAGFSEDRGHVAFAWLTPDGPAARAGVNVGDRLVAVDGQVVRDSTEAESRTRGAPGTPVRLHVRRANGEQEVLVTRAE